MSTAPSLTHVADLFVEVASPVALGDTPQGLRRIVPITGGRITGPRLSGTVLGVGADYQLIRADGFTTLDARYMIKLDGGDMIYVINEGVRYGPPALMAKITLGEPVDPDALYFRTAPRFETAAASYQWLTQPLFLAKGVRHPDRVEIAIFEVG